jgi:cytochrome c
VIATNDTLGRAPFKVKLSGKSSFDYDEDMLAYEWDIDGKKILGTDLAHTFETNGSHRICLKVTDPSGATDADTLEIKVGNTLPKVSVSTTDNSTFFFDKVPFHYTTSVQDDEDKSIDPANLMISLKYVPRQLEAKGHQLMNFNLGKSLMESSDCKACHQLNGKSVGPAFIEVSKRYQNDKGALNRLAAKVIAGGGGAWGDHAMNAHPQLSKEDAVEIVKYVLSLSATKREPSLPPEGVVSFTKHKNSDVSGRYMLSVSYTDNGGKSVPLTSSASLMLRAPRVQAEEADALRNISRRDNALGGIHHKSYFVLKQIDLKGMRKITYRYSSLQAAATLEVHVNSPKGPVISTLTYPATGSWDAYKEITTTIQDPGGKNDLYFVFKKEDLPNRHLFDADWIEFKR